MTGEPIMTLHDELSFFSIQLFRHISRVTGSKNVRILNTNKPFVLNNELYNGM